MDTFEFDSDAFYICTEISPRNFVVQKAIQIDKSQIERMVGKLDGKKAVTVEKNSSAENSSTSSAHSPGTSPSTSSSFQGGVPQPPPLPYWFDRECRQTLLKLGPQPSGGGMMPTSLNSHPNQNVPMTRAETMVHVKYQLQELFSNGNQDRDRFLRLLKDAENYIPVHLIANLDGIRRLTDDMELILEAMNESDQVEMNGSGDRIRASTKRITIAIREIPGDRRDIVEKLLEPKTYQTLIYSDADSWYATYEDELDTQIAYVAIQGKKINPITNRALRIKIKTGGPPMPLPAPIVMNYIGGRLTVNDEHRTMNTVDQGYTLGLGEHGFVPVATYRHTEAATHYTSPTFSFSLDQYGNPQQLTHPPPPLIQSAPQTNSQYQIQVMPRNYDELSTGSSTTSTRTSTSNYNIRSTGTRNIVNGGNNHITNGSNGHHNNQYYESRNNFSSSNEYRNNRGEPRADHRVDYRSDNRGGSNGRYQNNYQRDQNESNITTRQTNGRGGGTWRGATTQRNGPVTNGHTYQHNPRQNGYQSNWRNDQNGFSNNWNHSNSNEAGGGQNNYYNNRSNYNNSHNRACNNPQPVLSSSTSPGSSKNDYSDVPESTNTSAVSTRPSTSNSYQDRQPPYVSPPPIDMPTPPVWPAAGFDSRRKSSEASSATVTTNTNTLTPSTPAPSMSDFPPVFVDEPVLNKIQEMKINEKPKETPNEKKEENGSNHSNHVIKPVPKVEPKVELKLESKPDPPKPDRKSVEKETIRSPPFSKPSPSQPSASPSVTSAPSTSSSFAFEENAFPSLPQKVEPVKPPQKPSFSSVVGNNLKKRVVQMPPIAKISYAQTLMPHRH